MICHYLTWHLSWPPQHKSPDLPVFFFTPPLKINITKAMCYRQFIECPSQTVVWNHLLAGMMAAWLHLVVYAVNTLAIEQQGKYECWLTAADKFSFFYIHNEWPTRNQYTEMFFYVPNAKFFQIEFRNGRPKWPKPKSIAKKKYPQIATAVAH